MHDAAFAIFVWFTAQGCSPACAAGILAHLQPESNFNPCAESATGMGLPQWVGRRRLRARAVYCDLYGQLRLIDTELREFGIRKQLYTATNPVAAASLFYQGFEMPGHALPMRRAVEARKWYEIIKGQSK